MIQSPTPGPQPIKTPDPNATGDRPLPPTLLIRCKGHCPSQPKAQSK